MKKYFLKINIYSPKNKAHAAVQNFAMQYEKCLIDETEFFQFVEEMKDKIASVNLEFKRCQDIQLQFRKLNLDTFYFSVESNFSFSVYEVKRYELEVPARDWGRDLMGDMKADAQ